MDMNKQDLLMETSGICFLSGGVMLKDILGYISLILGILISLFALIKTIYNWFKKAKEDKKITKEEVKELFTTLLEDNKKDIDKISNNAKIIKDKVEETKENK